MNHFKSLLLVFAVMFCILGLNRITVAAQAPDPIEQFRPFVEKIVSVLTDPDLQGPEKCAQRRDKAMQVAQERFDFEEMSKRVLGRTWNTLNKDQQTYFVTLFTKLLEHAYIGKIEDYSKQKVVFKNERVKDDRAQVNTDIVDNDVSVAVSYIMLLENNVWMVYDIVVEGVSLVRNYMAQFKEILRKDGYPHLLKMVEDKVTELEKSIGRPCPVEIPEKKAS